MLMTPLGNPALAESSANLSAVNGVTLGHKGKQIKHNIFLHVIVLATTRSKKKVFLIVQ